MNKYFVLGFFALVFPIVAGAVIYTPLAPVPGVETASISKYLFSLIKILIGVAGLIAVGRIILCGFELLTAPGPSQLEKSRHCLLMSIVGVLLALAAYVILNTINPTLNNADLLLPDLPETTTTEEPPAPGGGTDCPTGASCAWSTAGSAGCSQLPKCDPRAGVTRSAGGDSACGGTKPANATCCVYTPTTCPGCVALSPLPGSGSQLYGTLKYKLITLRDQSTKAWRVTGAYPASIGHCSNDQMEGKSVDINFTGGGGTVAEIKDLILTARALELRLVFETADTTIFNALAGEGFTSGPTGNIFLDTHGHITGNHFSVYLQ